MIPNNKKPLQDSLTLYSPAKINIRLEILKKRKDGYHEIRTIFQKISLYDEITLKTTSEKGIRVTVNDPSIPVDYNNLAFKAASFLINDQRLATGLSININKKIPAGAGLGGGSSNAGTTLKGLNTLLNLNLSLKYLQKLSLSIGADVPFLLSEFNTAIATGIGEKLKPLTLKTKLWFLVVFPGLNISTRWAYNAFSKYNLLTKRGKNIIVENSVANIENTVSMLVNDFEDIVFSMYPEIKKINNNLMKAGAAGSLLSGSGSSVFGVFSAREDAEKALSGLTLRTSHKAFIVHSL